MKSISFSLKLDELSFIFRKQRANIQFENLIGVDIYDIFSSYFSTYSLDYTSLNAISILSRSEILLSVSKLLSYINNGAIKPAIKKKAVMTHKPLS